MDDHLRRIEGLIRSGELKEADRQLDGLSSAEKSRADVFYLRGFLAEKQHQFEDATDLYDRALAADPGHRLALFRQAYVIDLRGDDDRAIELYQKCVQTLPAPVHAMLNLAVLYEDHGRYQEAEACLRRVLNENPNHTRARLFLKDAEASLVMYYDEDVERARQQHSAILDTPISDFELSVRSRNCLKQMNLQTIGDLLKITEAELLAYKNFGETSLNEIKAMLRQKGLRLGQILEEAHTDTGSVRRAASTTGNPEVLNRSVTELELSARSRKCLQRLGILTFGELATRSEQELLAIKNFGQTSLNEIKRRLTEVGLSLAGPRR